MRIRAGSRLDCLNYVNQNGGKRVHLREAGRLRSGPIVRFVLAFLPAFITERIYIARARRTVYIRNRDFLAKETKMADDAMKKILEAKYNKIPRDQVIRDEVNALNYTFLWKEVNTLALDQMHWLSQYADDLEALKAYTPENAQRLQHFLTAVPDDLCEDRDIVYQISKKVFAGKGLTELKSSDWKNMADWARFYKKHQGMITIDQCLLLIELKKEASKADSHLMKLNALLGESILYQTLSTIKSLETLALLEEALSPFPEVPEKAFQKVLLGQIKRKLTSQKAVRHALNDVVDKILPLNRLYMECEGLSDEVELADRGRRRENLEKFAFQPGLDLFDKGTNDAYLTSIIDWKMRAREQQELMPKKKPGVESVSVHVPTEDAIFINGLTAKLMADPVSVCAPLAPPIFHQLAGFSDEEADRIRQAGVRLARYFLEVPIVRDYLMKLPERFAKWYAEPTPGTEKMHQEVQKAVQAFQGNRIEEASQRVLGIVSEAIDRKDPWVQEIMDKFMGEIKEAREIYQGNKPADPNNHFQRFLLQFFLTDMMKLLKSSVISFLIKFAGPRTVGAAMVAILPICSKFIKTYVGWSHEGSCPPELNKPIESLMVMPERFLPDFLGKSKMLKDYIALANQLYTALTQKAEPDWRALEDELYRISKMAMEDAHDRYKPVVLEGYGQLRTLVS